MENKIKLFVSHLSKVGSTLEFPEIILGVKKRRGILSGVVLSALSDRQFQFIDRSKIFSFEKTDPKVKYTFVSNNIDIKSNFLVSLPLLSVLIFHSKNSEMVTMIDLDSGIIDNITFTSFFENLIEKGSSQICKIVNIETESF